LMQHQRFGVNKEMERSYGPLVNLRWYKWLARSGS
jgi:hypothetical protein